MNLRSSNRNIADPDHVQLRGERIDGASLPPLVALHNVLMPDNQATVATVLGERFDLRPGLGSLGVADGSDREIDRRNLVGQQGVGMLFLAGTFIRFVPGRDDAPRQLL